MKIYQATNQDIPWMVNLSHQKRLEYSKVQPNFWKMSENSDSIQSQYFAEEIAKEEVIALCYQDQKGFIIGKLINPPEVYDAGLTLMIDDFCVEDSNLWQSTGKELLKEIISLSKGKNAKQILVVCGDHDLQKRNLLDDMNLSITSNWYSKVI